MMKLYHCKYYIHMQKIYPHTHMTEIQSQLRTDLYIYFKD